MRRHRVALTSGVVALVLAGGGAMLGGAMLLGLFTSAVASAPTGGPSPVAVSGSPVAVSGSPGTATPPGSSAGVGDAAPPTIAPAVPGTHGDGYFRNVTAGDTCSPAGALGFTTEMKPVLCETTATDPQLRWRTL